MTIINNIIQSDAAAATSGNTIYSDYQERWQYLLESYIGGEVYRDGLHLTKYQLESGDEYNQRLKSAHLDNHCSSVISVYNSFLFREEPFRDLGTLTNLPSTQSFLKDADKDGTSFGNFMKDVSTFSSIFGHCWVIVSKPNIGANTLAEEQQSGVRPYVNLITPLNMLDWNWERQIDGSYRLDYIRYIEDSNGNVRTIKEWTPESITTRVIDLAKDYEQSRTVENNELGMIPAVIAYNKKTSVRGIGMGDINDIADVQKFIYNMQNELEQTIRLDSHPSLVTTPDVIAGNGSGSIVQIPNDLDPGLKPYLLTYNGASASSIMDAVNNAVASIDKMANIGSIRATEARRASGVAQQQEFELLNARLSEKGDNLELCEENIWELFAAYTGQTFTGYIEYPNSFNIRDVDNEYAQLETAKKAVTNPSVLKIIDERIIELLGEDPKEYLTEEFVPHIMVSPEGEQVTANTEADHVRLTAEGYTHINSEN
jgi:hypothetical protein